MRELNWKPGQSAELTVLGVGPSTVPGTHPARILDISGKRLRLAAELPAEMNCGAAVRLEWDGQLVLGQVLSTEPQGFWMEIHHMLLDAAALSWRKNGWQSGSTPDAR
jgi:hypothetical protein